MSVDSSQFHKLVVLGASTGGFDSISRIIPMFDHPFQSVIFVIQHMPEWMTASYIHRLKQTAKLPIHEIHDGEQIQSGNCYVLPGGCFLQFRKTGSVKLVRSEGDAQGILNINGSFESIIERYGGERIVGAILSGMGKDGAAALLKIRQQGGFTIAEDESTTAVFGMPREAIQLGAAMKVLPCDRIAEEIIKVLKK